MSSIKIFDEITFSWKRRAMIFLSSFTIIWLLINPLTKLAIGKQFINKTGILGYLGLLMICLVLTFLLEKWMKYKHLKRMEFLKLIIILSKEGSRFEVDVPKDLEIKSFIRLFFKRIEKTINNRSIISSWELYNTNLLVKRNAEFQEVQKHLSFEDAKIKNRDVCIIKGEILSEYESIKFSK